MKAKLKRKTLGYSLDTSGNVPRDEKIWEFYKVIQLSI